MEDTRTGKSAADTDDGIALRKDISQDDEYHWTQTGNHERNKDSWSEQHQNARTRTSHRRRGLRMEDRERRRNGYSGQQR